MGNTSSYSRKEPTQEAINSLEKHILNTGQELNKVRSEIEHWKLKNNWSLENAEELYNNPYFVELKEQQTVLTEQKTRLVELLLEKEKQKTLSLGIHSLT